LRTLSTRAVMDTLKVGEEISFGRDRGCQTEGLGREGFFRPDILGKPETIYKKPGYDPL